MTKIKQHTTKPEFLVTQSNQLIEAQYSRNLSTLAHKTAKLILGKVNPRIEAKELSIDIDISNLKRFLGWKEGTTWNRFRADLKDISNRLNKEPIEILQGKDKLVAIYFLSSYTLDFKKGVVTFDISPKLVPYLLQLKKGFTTYELKYIPNLSSIYAIRLYELLIQFRKIGRRELDIITLKKSLATPPKYSYNDLKKRAIIPAQKQLKQHTNISFIFNEIKAGRSIVKLEFIIFGNTPQKENPNQLSFLLDEYTEIENSPDKPALPETIIRAMNDLGISEQNIAKYLTLGFDIISNKEKKEGIIERCKTLENYYLEKLELTKHSTKSGNAAGLFIKALKEDWTSSKTIQNIKAETVAKDRSKAQKYLRSLTQKIDKLSNQRKTLKSAIITKLVANDSILEVAYKAVLESMSPYMKDHLSDVLHLPIKEQYAKAVGISSGVAVYLMEHYPDHFKEIVIIDKQTEPIRQEVEMIKKRYPSFK